jgi:hypothetical protein
MSGSPFTRAVKPCSSPGQERERLIGVHPPNNGGCKYDDNKDPRLYRIPNCGCWSEIGILVNNQLKTCERFCLPF